MSTKRKIYNIILAVLILLTVGFIWSRSFASPSESAGESGAVYGTIRKIITAIFGEENANAFFNVFSELFLRKLAHMTEFAILGIEINLLFISLFGFKYINLIYITLCAVFVASADELIQHFVGRDGKITDVLIDVGGYLISTGIITLIMFLKSRKKAKTNTAKNA